MKRLRSRGLRERGVQRAALVLLAVFGLAACRREKEEVRPKPVPSASAKPQAPRSVCAQGGAAVGHPTYAAWFPQTVAGFCLDPNADQRVFGAKATLPLEDAAELVSADLEHLGRLGLTEVATVAYVEDREEPSRVAVTALTFATQDGAYAFFTERLAEAKELGRPVFRPLAAGTEAVLGEGSAFVVRANAVLRLDFTSRRLPPQQVAAAAAPALTALGGAVAERMPGKSVLPPAARLLPTANRVPLSMRYDAVDLLRLDGVGPGAFAAYDDGARHFRLALFVRADMDAAEDVLSTLRKLPGSRRIKNGPYSATRVVELDAKTGAGTEWIFGQKGVFVAGASLDAAPRAAPRGAPPERDQTVLVMKRLLDGLHGAGPW
jgi:hypothetical protein